jgi:uncharacterized protein YuzE
MAITTKERDVFQEKIIVDYEKNGNVIYWKAINVMEMEILQAWKLGSILSNTAKW